MQQSSGGAQRRADRLRADRPRASTSSRFNDRSIRAARAIRSRVGRGLPLHVRPLSTWLAAAMHRLATAERVLPVAVAAIVAIASLLAFLPGPSVGAVGSTQGSGNTVRIAIGGGAAPAASDAQTASDARTAGVAANIGTVSQSFEPLTIPDNIGTQPATDTTPAQAGEFLADGTLVTGYAPLTTVEDGASLITTYKVKSGDTLVSIAGHYGVSMMTLWWANKLASKDALKVGQTLRIPPVNGLVVTVTASDTLDSLAAKYNVNAADITSLNQLADPTLVVGQVLIIPGATGAPVPTPKPTPKPVTKSSTASSSSAGLTSRYSGGRFQWPVIGGGNYISQYYHYGHWAIDIAAAYGSKVVAAAAGVVTFAGWKNNGGGYQVWISHGSGLYTTYNHMSAITVGAGQSVARGRQVGRIGMTGDATGPHLHFEVWIGPIWNGGTRVNPLSYF